MIAEILPGMLAMPTSEGCDLPKFDLSLNFKLTIYN